MYLAPTTLQGKFAIVTGAGAGIGRAITQALALSGARILAIDREPEGLVELADLPSVTPFEADITDSSLPGRLTDRFEGDGLDILVNNAGIGRGGHALATSDDEFTRYFEVNLLGAFRLSRWAVKRMIARGGGAIVNIASIFAVVGAQNSCGYSASKAALLGLTRQMATDFGPNAIRVNAVAPGLIATSLTLDRIQNEPWRRQQMIDTTPLRRVGTVEDVARAVRFLVSDEACFITGQTLCVDGGWAMGRYPQEKVIHDDL